MAWTTRIYILVCFTCLLASCNNQDAPAAEGRTATGLFADFHIMGSEELGEVTVRLQFRSGHIEGEPRLLDAQAGVTLDGLPLPADSSRMNGAYYELAFRLEDFEGDHEIAVSLPGGRNYRTKFRYPSFSLLQEPGERISRAAGLELLVQPAAKDDAIHAILTDTSYYGRGLDRTDSISNGRLFLEARDLARLKNGPVHLELFREQEQWLEPPGSMQGRLYMSFSLSREFILED